MSNSGKTSEKGMKKLKITTSGFRSVKDQNVMSPLAPEDIRLSIGNFIEESEKYDPNTSGEKHVRASNY